MGARLWSVFWGVHMHCCMICGNARPGDGGAGYLGLKGDKSALSSNAVRWMFGGR